MVSENSYRSWSYCCLWNATSPQALMKIMGSVRKIIEKNNLADHIADRILYGRCWGKRNPQISVSTQEIARLPTANNHRQVISLLLITTLLLGRDTCSLPAEDIALWITNIFHLSPMIVVGFFENLFLLSALLLSLPYKCLRALV